MGNNFYISGNIEKDVMRFYGRPMQNKLPVTSFIYTDNTWFVCLSVRLSDCCRKRSRQTIDRLGCATTKKSLLLKGVCVFDLRVLENYF